MGIVIELDNGKIKHLYGGSFIAGGTPKLWLVHYYSHCFESFVLQIIDHELVVCMHTVLHA